MTKPKTLREMLNEARIQEQVNRDVDEAFEKAIARYVIARHKAEQRKNKKPAQKESP